MILMYDMAFILLGVNVFIALTSLVEYQESKTYKIALQEPKGFLGRLYYTGNDQEYSFVKQKLRD